MYTVIYYEYCIVLTLCTFCTLGSTICKFYGSNSTVIKLPGECVIFGVCTCSSSTNIIWNFNNQRIFYRTRPFNNPQENWEFSVNNSVRINSVNESNVGIYTCLCTEIVQKQYILSLKKEGGPQLYVTLDGTNYTTNTTLTFNTKDLQYVALGCHARGEKPHSNLTLLIDNKYIASSITVQNCTEPSIGHCLTIIKNYSLTGHENVTCVRSVHYISDEQKIRINLLTYVQPQFYDTLDDDIYRTNTSITFFTKNLKNVFLGCHADGERSHLNLTLLIDNEYIDSSTTVQNCTTLGTLYCFTIMMNYSLIGHENLTCVRGGRYISHEQKIRIKPLKSDEIQSSTQVLPFTNKGFVLNENILWIIVSVSSVTFLIASMVAVLLVTLKRSKQRTDRQIQVYEERGATSNLRMEISSSPHDSVPEKDLLKRDNVTLLSKIPGGGKMKYWTAVLSSKDSNKFVFVAKTLSDSAQLTDLYNFQKIVKQFKSLTPHKNIVDILGFDDTAVPCFVYHHFEEGGTLRDFMLKSFDKRRESQLQSLVTLRPFEERKLQLIRFALDIADGMKFLRRNNICHPGICSRKVLLSRNGTCKLYDFVPENIAQHRMKSFFEKKCPPLAWLPPESIFLRRYSWKADVWSFAVVLWEIFSLGQTPYEGLSTEEIETEIRCDRCLSQPLCCPGGVYSIMLSSWNVSHEDRPTFSAITQNLRTAMESFKQEYDLENNVTEDPNYFVLEEPMLENEYKF